MDDLVEVGLLCLFWRLIPERRDLHRLDELERFCAVSDHAVRDGADGFARYLFGCVWMECPVRRS